MTDYTELVKKLRDLHRDPRPASAVWLFDNQVALYDAAAAIEELEARLGEAENSVERWKDMYLTKHEPKRGEWVEENRRPRSSQFVCSVCHRTAYDPQPTRDKAWRKRCRYLYCPNCGANMTEAQDG